MELCTVTVQGVLHRSYMELEWSFVPSPRAVLNVFAQISDEISRQIFDELDRQLDAQLMAELDKCQEEQSRQLDDELDRQVTQKS